MTRMLVLACLALRLCAADAADPVAAAADRLALRVDAAAMTPDERSALPGRILGHLRAYLPADLPAEEVAPEGGAAERLPEGGPVLQDLALRQRVLDAIVSAAGRRRVQPLDAGQRARAAAAIQAFAGQVDARLPAGIDPALRAQLIASLRAMCEVHLDRRESYALRVPVAAATEQGLLAAFAKRIAGPPPAGDQALVAAVRSVATAWLRASVDPTQAAIDPDALCPGYRAASAELEMAQRNVQAARRLPAVPAAATAAAPGSPRAPMAPSRQSEGATASAVAVVRAPEAAAAPRPTIRPWIVAAAAAATAAGLVLLWPRRKRRS